MYYEEVLEKYQEKQKILTPEERLKLLVEINQYIKKTNLDIITFLNTIR
jgi:hypothetical protein